MKTQKGRIRVRNQRLTWLELRGFEPPTPSMRTPATEVARGRWGRSAADGGLSEPLVAGGVAVLVRCTAPCLSDEVASCDRGKEGRRGRGGRSRGFQPRR